MKFVPYVACLMLIAVSLEAENIFEKPAVPFASVGEGPLFYVDYNSYLGFEKATYVEFYFQISYEALQFIRAGKKYQAGYELNMSIRNIDNNIVEKHYLDDSFEVVTFAETVSSRLARISMAAFTLKPGRYFLRTEIRDRETHHTSTIEAAFLARDYSSDDLQISAIQFSRDIKPGEDGQPYVKNQRYIEPNTVRTFAHGFSEIFLYFEVYNLLRGEDPGNEYALEYTIRDAISRIVGRFKKKHVKVGLTSAHSLKLRIDHFLGGDYSLVVKIEDLASGRTAEATNYFSVVTSALSLNEDDLRDDSGKSVW